MDERELLIEQAPEIYCVTDHYRGFPTVLVSLDRVPMDKLRHLLERRWRAMAPAKLVQAFDDGRSEISASSRPKPQAKKRAIRKSAQNKKPAGG
jgi:hypothetical protein